MHCLNIIDIVSQFEVHISIDCEGGGNRSPHQKTWAGVVSRYLCIPPMIAIYILLYFLIPYGQLYKYNAYKIIQYNPTCYESLAGEIFIRINAISFFKI